MEPQVKEEEFMWAPSDNKREKKKTQPILEGDSRDYEHSQQAGNISHELTNSCFDLAEFSSPTGFEGEGHHGVKGFKVFEKDLAIPMYNSEKKSAIPPKVLEKPPRPLKKPEKTLPHPEFRSKLASSQVRRRSVKKPMSVPQYRKPQPPPNRSKPSRNKKEMPRPIPVHEIDRLFKNYRNMNVYRCGPHCKCYYCVLLKLSSSDDSSEGDERDTIALAYGFNDFDDIKPQIQKKRTKRRKKRNHRSGKGKESIYHDHHHHHHQSISNQIGDNARVNPTKREITSGPILQGVPNYVRNFERLLYETRQESMRDSFLDSIVGFISWFWDIVYATCATAYRNYRGKRRVSPGLSVLSDIVRTRVPFEYGDCDLLSVEVVRDGKVKGKF